MQFEWDVIPNGLFIVNVVIHRYRLCVGLVYYSLWWHFCSLNVMLLATVMQHPRVTFSSRNPSCDVQTFSSISQDRKCCKKWVWQVDGAVLAACLTVYETDCLPLGLQTWLHGYRFYCMPIYRYDCMPTDLTICLQIGLNSYISDWLHICFCAYRSDCMTAYLPACQYISACLLAQYLSVLPSYLPFYLYTPCWPTYLFVDLPHLQPTYLVAFISHLI